MKTYNIVVGYHTITFVDELENSDQVSRPVKFVVTKNRRNHDRLDVFDLLTLIIQ